MAARRLIYVVMILLVAGEIAVAWSAVRVDHTDDFEKLRPPLFTFLATLLALAVATVAINSGSKVAWQGRSLPPVFIISILCCAAIYFSAFPNRLLLNSANGVYLSSTSGGVRLENGILYAGNTSTRYVVQSDKNGAYILPEHYVVFRDSGVSVSQAGRWPYIQRLDREANPQTLTLFDGSRDETFHRQGRPQ